MHVVVATAEVGFDEETCLDSFCDAWMDRGEETHGADDDHEEIYGEPEVDVLHAVAEDQVTEKQRNCNQEDSCHDPKVSHS